MGGGSAMLKYVIDAELHVGRGLQCHFASESPFKLCVQLREDLV